MTVTNFWLLLLEGTFAFTATNIDNFVLLIVLLQASGSKENRKNIILSQCLCLIIVIVVSMLGSLCKFILPSNQIGFLGFIPLLYGIKKLFSKKTPYPKSANYPLIIMIILALSDSLDNISVYTALFAKETLINIGILSSYFSLLLIVWYYAARAFAGILSVTFLRKKANRIIPFIYIGLGILIMYEDNTLTVLLIHTPLIAF